MKFHIHKALAVGAAVAIIAPIATAFAAPVAIPDPAIPPLPAAVPITLFQGPHCTGPAKPTDSPTDKCTLKDLLPPTVLPDPAAVLAMLQGQVTLIAAALGEQPG